MRPFYWPSYFEVVSSVKSLATLISCSSSCYGNALYAVTYHLCTLLLKTPFCVKVVSSLKSSNYTICYVAGCYKGYVGFVTYHLRKLLLKTLFCVKVVSSMKFSNYTICCNCGHYNSEWNFPTCHLEKRRQVFETPLIVSERNICRMKGKKTGLGQSMVNPRMIKKRY